MFRFCEGEESDLKKAARDSGGLTANGLEYPTDVFSDTIIEKCSGESRICVTYRRD